MAEEEEEEIMAEESPSNGLALSGLVSTIVRTIESYGWFILLGIVVAVIFWKRVVAPKLAAHRKEQSLVAAKKYDENVLLERQQAMEAARLRLQEKYAEDARKAQEKAEEKRREQAQLEVEEWERHKQGRGYHSKQHNETEKPSTSAKPATLKRTGATKGPQTDVSRDPRAFIETLVNSKPVVVFSKSWCPFCNKAKQALSCYRLSSEFYEVVELDERTDGDPIQDILNEMTGRRSVPRVFIGGRCIGGGDETTAAHRSGELERMLKDCGAI